MATLLLVNERTGHLVASAVEIASSRRARRKGLLGRDRIELAEALVLTPCCAVHTAFMRMPIDVAFVDREGRVVRLVREMKPWNAALSLRAHAAIEFAAGSLRSHDLKLGDRLCVRPVFEPSHVERSPGPATAPFCSVVP
jgi:uncharacterized membrane protein (UPF0127 family)